MGEKAAINDGVNLRAWFAGFLLWLIGLTAAASWGLAEIDGNGSGMGWAVWILAGYAFYMSLCCTFFPAPTTWVVMLVASDMVAAQLGLEGHGLERLIVVSTIGAAATGLANLNEYHVFVYLLRKRRVAKVRDTRLYRTADAWFRTNPFWILTLFSFLPIPVDVIRWLAISTRYSRWLFFLASVAGRWFRYAIWAVATLGLHLETWHILALQAGLVAVALVRIAPRMIRRIRGGGNAATDQALVEGEASTDKEAQFVAREVGGA